MKLLIGLILLGPCAAVAIDFRGAAENELTVSGSKRSAQILSTPATVRPRVEAISSPITHKAMQMGLSVSPFRPEGQGQVGDLTTYEYESLGTRPLPSLEFRWQPYDIPRIPKLYVGGFASLGYTAHDVRLRGVTGAPLPSTKLHTLKGAGGLAATYLLGASHRWSLGGLFGLGYLNSVQASRSNLANTSAGLPFLSFSALGQWRFAAKWTSYAGLELRSPVRAEGEQLRLPRSALMIGLLGSVR